LLVRRTHNNTGAVETGVVATRSTTKAEDATADAPVAVAAASAAKVRSEVPSTAVALPETHADSSPPSLAVSRLRAASPLSGAAVSGPVGRSRRRVALLYAEGETGLAAMFKLRTPATRPVEIFGGTAKAVEKVQSGLKWLEIHQFKNGSWSLHDFDRECDRKQRSKGYGSVRSDVAATGFALLPFLGYGHTHRKGDYRELVDRGLKWLVAGQQKSGELTTGKEGNARMYSHGIAAIARCEAYGMTKDPALRGPAQKSIDFIAAAQHRGGGGWRYQPGQPGDTSVFGWQIMALKSAEMAGLKVPDATLSQARKWLQRVEGNGRNRGQAGYTNRNPKLEMTAEAMLCKAYLGAPRNDSTLRAGADHLLKNLPRKNQQTSYYWYYGTQIMFHLQGNYWKQWNGALQNMLIETQRTSGPAAGTWDPRDNWERSGGRIYSTCMRLLMLEAYYRHLPLYQALER